MLVDYLYYQFYTLLSYGVRPVFEVLCYKFYDLIIEKTDWRILDKVRKDIYGLSPDSPVLIGDHFLQDWQHRLWQSFNAQGLANKMHLLKDGLFDLLFLLVLEKTQKLG